MDEQMDGWMEKISLHCPNEKQTDKKTNRRTDDQTDVPINSWTNRLERFRIDSNRQLRAVMNSGTRALLLFCCDFVFNG